MNDGLLCISVCASSVKDMIADIKQAEELADVIEVRFDCLRDEDFVIALEQLDALQISKPLLATLRPNIDADLTPVKRVWRKNDNKKREKHAVESAKRFRRWLDILDVKSIRYVDFEYDIHAKLTWCMTLINFWDSGYEAKLERVLAAKLKGRQLILSEHYFLQGTIDADKTYGRLAPRKSDTEDTDAIEEVAYIEPAVLKIASTSYDIIDSIAIWRLLERARCDSNQIIPIAMGEAGKWTRILGLAHGAFLTYASLDAGKETADGQLTARDMVDVYRVKQLDRETRVHGVIGDPVSQSMSPYMHNAAFAATGENAVFMHLLVKDLDAFIARMVKPETREVDLNFAGLSVTMPHKQAIMRHLDSIDPTAAAIGAVNTVKIDPDGRMTGYNTDAHGFITPLKASRGDLSGSSVAVVGAGGAARAVVYALKQENAEVLVFGRDPRKMERLGDELSVAVKPISDLRSEISDLDILVNATPVGMKGPLKDETLLSADELSGVEFVYDLVTRADGTPLQHAAAAAGIPCIGGLEMLIAQGARQFEIWTGREAPRQLMRDAIVQRMGG